jgi:DNA-binding MarR family transcriptional regulator
VPAADQPRAGAPLAAHGEGDRRHRPAAAPGVTAGQLAQALHVDPGTLSASLRRLEGRGLIERRRDPADTRRVTLGLTRQGRALDVPRPGTVEAAADALLADASARDLAATVRVLDRFAELLLDDGDPS